jgi:molecular chaperone GrpE
MENNEVRNINEARISNGASNIEDGDVEVLDTEIENADASVPPMAPASASAAPQADARYNELNDKYMRLYADFDNYRKRIVKEKEDIFKYAAEPMTFDMLAVIDNLEMALSHVPKEQTPTPGEQSKDPLALGVAMTLKEMMKVLAKYGLTQVDCLGKPFDPAFQHAISEVERDDLDDKTVVEQMRKGYVFKERVIRPAMVSVSKKSSPTVLTVTQSEEITDNDNIKEDNNG